MTDSKLETFYVYRTLNPGDESWGAIIGLKSTLSLPNLSFGMKVYAVNEKAAIARGRDLYDRIHKFDNDKDNIRRFAASALKTNIKIYAGSIEGPNEKQLEDLASVSMNMAVTLNKQYRKYFDELALESEDEVE